MLNAQAAWVVTFSYPRNSEDDRLGAAVLCKIARFLWESMPGPQPESEQLRSAIPWWQGHHQPRDGHSCFLFQVPELSQPI